MSGERWRRNDEHRTVSGDRRLAEYGEKTKSPLIMVLLDWEKAFDKVDREGMFAAMERMGVPDKLVNITKQMYKKT